VREFDLQLPRHHGTTLRHLRIRLPERFNIGRRLQRTGLAGYEPHTLACCLAALDVAPPGTFFDVGANVGVFSWLVAAATDRAVTAFEPVPWLLDGVRSVASANALEIRCEAIALSSSSGPATFYVSAKSDCSNSLREGFRKASETLDVAVDTLDEYVERTALRPALLKIDTESTEPDVLSGGHGCIRHHKPWIVCEVLAGRTEAELMKVLASLEYAWYQITDDDRWPERSIITGDRSYRFVNWLFVPGRLDEGFWSALANRREQLRYCTPEPGLVRVDVEANDLTTLGKESSVAGWTSTASAGNRTRATLDGLELVAKMNKGERYFVFNGRGQPRFDEPPPEDGAWSMTPGKTYELRVRLHRKNGSMPLQMWVLEYGDQEPLAHHKIRMAKGENRLRFVADGQSRRARVVFRVSGRGRVVVEDLATYEVHGAE
jgi:FkbM family methyltransferase